MLHTVLILLMVEQHLLFHVCSASESDTRAANDIKGQGDSYSAEPELGISLLPPEQNFTIVLDRDNLTSCLVNNQSFVVTAPVKDTRLDPAIKVYFTVGMNYAPGLNVKFLVRTPEEIYKVDTWTPSGECGEFQTKIFEVYNPADNPGYGEDSLTHAPELTVLVSIGTGEAGGDGDCLDRLCKTYVLSYDFLPSPKKIKLHHSPQRIRAGQKGTVHCSNTDGNPVAKPFAIRVLDHETAQPILVANVTTLAMESSLAGKYQCLVLSHAFGKQTVVVSDTTVDVVGSLSRESIESREKGNRLGESSIPLDVDEALKKNKGLNDTLDTETLHGTSQRDPRKENSKSSANFVNCDQPTSLVALSLLTALLFYHKA